MKALLIILILLSGNAYAQSDTTYVSMTICSGKDTVMYGGTAGLMFNNFSEDTVNVYSLDGYNVNIFGLREGTGTVIFWPSMDKLKTFIYTGNIINCK